jgi:hypothetical protein
MAKPSTIYDMETFLNVFYAFHIYLETYFANRLLGGDLSRVVWASNAYALRKRAPTDKDGDTIDDVSNLRLPFINYKLTNMDFEEGSVWWNNYANVAGIYLPDMGKKYRVFPCTMTYEMTYWCSRNDELYYASAFMTLDQSNETIVRYFIEDDGKQIELSANFSFELSDMDGEYDQNDWLEKNKIHNLALNPAVRTYMLFADSKDKFNITEEAILNFLSTKGTINRTDPMLTDPQELLALYFNQDDV